MRRVLLMKHEDINPRTARILLRVFLDADLHYHLNGTPHHVYLAQQAKKHLGQARRLITQVANLGPDAKKWMAVFIGSMNEE